MLTSALKGNLTAARPNMTPGEVVLAEFLLTLIETLRRQDLPETI